MLWTEEDRAIFAWADDAGRQRRADPLVLYRDLVRGTEGQLARLYDLAIPSADAGPRDAAGELAQEAATEALVGAVRFVFGLTPYDPETGKGSTVRMAVATLGAFYDWMAALKGKAAPSPT